MGIIRESLFGNSAIGPYLSISNEILLYPSELPEEKLISIKRAFPKDFPMEVMNLWNSALLGSYIVMNSKGILLPSITLEKEIIQLEKILKKIGKAEIKIGYIDAKDNALGNLILCNNNGAIISESLSKNAKLIQETLDVEVMILNYAGNHLPGSSGVANNKGCLVHPMVTDSEAKLISDILKVPVDVSTINLGNPFIRSGAIVNDFGGIFGERSTGPELMRLTNILQL